MSFFLHDIEPEPPAGTPVIGLQDRGFLLGDGVFDTAVAIGGPVFAAARHAERLAQAGEAIGIACEAAAILGKIEAMGDACAGRDVILRTTLTRGIAARGLWPAEPTTPTLVVTAQPWSRKLIGEPARLCLGRIPRNQRSPLASIKALAYLDNILAARQASEEGCDDALILNLDGRVACSTIANVFALRDGTLVTPPTSEGCLPGILRRIVLEEAPGLGLTPIEAPLGVDELRASEACFLTNSVRLLRPVTAIGGTGLNRSARLADLLDAVLARIISDSGARMARHEISPAFDRYLP